ncbi:MAG: helix-turn-helix transcriptional regulator [Ferruginibacter sp.]
MNKRKTDIDRGKLLKEMVEESGISKTKLVKKIGYKHRASYYSHIATKNLSLDILQQYATALNYDLKQHFPDYDFIVAEDDLNSYYSEPKDMEAALSLIQKWKDRYYKLLDKHMSLIEKGEK